MSRTLQLVVSIAAFILLSTLRHASARYRDNVRGDVCELVGLCEDTDNYPKELADRLLEELGDKRKYLPMDKLDETDGGFRRVGDGSSAVCPAERKLINPTSAVDKYGITHMVLNDLADPIQGLIIEVCTSDSDYSHDYIQVQPGYTGACVQSYVHRILATVDVNTQSTGSQIVLVPSSCSFVVDEQN